MSMVVFMIWVPILSNTAYHITIAAIQKYLWIRFRPIRLDFGLNQATTLVGHVSRHSQNTPIALIT